MTGAGAGIGRAVAELLHARGANVTVADIDASAAAALAGSLSSLGPECLALHVDVANGGSVRTGVHAALERWGRVDILVNNAGISGESAAVWEATDANWDRVLGVNLTGMFHMCRAVVPHMRAGCYGRIVNMSSISARDGNAKASAYSASKAGVLGFTRAVALELADEGILVNAVSPAAVDTERALAGDQTAREPLLAKIPMGRGGYPGEVAWVVAFLASSACGFSTGANFDVSGGRANIT